jgi:hypothetical protein
MNVATLTCPQKGVVGRSTKCALGQKQTYAVQKATSALPPKADMRSALADVRFGPRADMPKAALALIELRLAY